MKTQNPNTQFDFAGLTDWFEVFRAGTHVDSKGVENTFTTDDLDSIVANHTAEQSAPLVVGHPKDNHPAYGWTSSLKREGNVLLAKAQDVVAEFEAAVKAKQFRNRSISIVPVSGGYKLRHIGFLGAVPPAVPGLADIAFATEDTAIEFSVEDATRSIGWRLNSVGRALRNIKNWFIEQNGADAAERLLPEYDLSELATASESVNAALAEPALNNHFSSHTTQGESGMPDIKTYTQQDLDAAIAAAVQPLKGQLDQMKTAAEQQAFNQRLADAKAFVTGLVSEGKLLPASTVGLVEFLASLPNDAESVFEFSQGEGTAAVTKKVPPFEFMSAFIGSLPKAVHLGRRSDSGEPDVTTGSDFSAPNGVQVANVDLDRKAMEYSQKNSVSYVDAVKIVSQED